MPALTWSVQEGYPDKLERPPVMAMQQAVSFPIRTACPPGACDCKRERLLSAPQADLRVLRLTRDEEKKLLTHIESITSYAELCNLEQRLLVNLGVVLRIAPGVNEVRTVRGLHIQLEQRLGLCRKIRQSIPTSVRRCVDKNPDIVYAILDAHDLLGQR